MDQATLDYRSLLRGKRALIVNCEPEIEEAVTALFSAHGCQTQPVHTLDALEIPQAADIIVCGMHRAGGTVFHTLEKDAVSQETFRNVQMLERAVHTAIGHMMNRCAGWVIAIVSEYGDYNVPMRSLEACSAQAMAGLIQSLAMDYCKYNIRANTILMPFQIGAVGAQQLLQQNISREASYDLQLLRRDPTAEDIANAALFLASDMSAFISGESIPINGGGFQIGHNQTWGHWLHHVI